MHDPQNLVQDRLTRNSWGFLGTQGYILGLDISSYGLRAALIDLQKHTYTSAHREPTTSDAQETLADVIALAQELMDEQGAVRERLVRIGVGFSGPVDARLGITILSPRFSGWERFPLKERIEDTFGAVTLVDNDANLIALAEATFGVGCDAHQIFYLHLSSGVGGGLVLNGRLYHGATTTAGEIGHALVGQIDPIWSKERPGTLEQHLSAKGLLQRAAALGLQTDQLSDVFGNHPIGRQILAEATDMLGLHLSQVIALIDPQMIVLGGIVTRSGGDAFVASVRERTHDYMVQLVDRPIQIVASVLGIESVAIGALALALESMRD